MFINKDRNSRIGRWYFGWYTRTGERMPRIHTECDVRAVLIYQLLHWIRTHKIVGTHVRPWMVVVVGFFALASALAPGLMAWFIIIPLVIVVAAAIVIPTMGILWGITSLSSVERLFHRLGDLLADPMSRVWQILKGMNDRLWQIRVLGWSVAWILIPTALIIFQITMVAWYWYSQSTISCFLLLSLIVAEFVSFALFVIAILSLIYEKYNPWRSTLQVVRKLIGKPSRAARDSEKPKGLYKLLLDLGICRYIEW